MQHAISVSDVVGLQLFISVTRYKWLFEPLEQTKGMIFFKKKTPS